ncbi:hypothetical protein [Brevundimonas aurifodinae]|uniref:Uncharacterized protein n=2 Tax=Brevundimonas TaxID=41275 RepID=A0ABV1NNL9_9CAUL|nr:MAG: hypothetical protein B7Z42_06815 [Brevundimonas sp. 12-68-7]OYX34205.1 MAG: hypothetical protein B7Z01_06505 [Brevundimonas subvibrioides]
MRKKPSLFTANERRIALIVLLTAGVLTLGIMALEGMFRPSLGLYGSSMSAPSLPNVIDAQPLAKF